MLMTTQEEDNEKSMGFMRFRASRSMPCAPGLTVVLGTTDGVRDTEEGEVVV
jgi:hypothetical protein